jgi:hypothetical protein
MNSRKDTKDHFLQCYPATKYSLDAGIFDAFSSVFKNILYSLGCEISRESEKRNRHKGGQQKRLNTHSQIEMFARDARESLNQYLK